jgi:dinuclear metal center YbgI/SA1388 family protein
LTIQLEQYLRELLQPERFRDHTPNGLQIEGRPALRKLVTGVTASAAFLEAAAAAGADAVLVHHGYFWRNEDPRVIGVKRRRVAYLIQRDINLFAFHLPLDAHPEFGNNAQLAKLLHFRPAAQTGEQDLLWVGELPVTLTLGALVQHVSRKLDRWVLPVGEPRQPVRRIAWCTGAAQDGFETAIAAGVDAYLTGEASERCVHLARESGVAFLAAGHHATERYGVQALGAHLAEKFLFEHEFIDIASPV